jgi:serine/threonine-protein kinase
VDIYALGIVIYEAITGLRPFPGQSAEDIALARVLKPFPDIPRNLPSNEMAMLHRMLAKEPYDRPSAQEVATAFSA